MVGETSIRPTMKLLDLYATKQHIGFQVEIVKNVNPFLLSVQCVVSDSLFIRLSPIEEENVSCSGYM